MAYKNTHTYIHTYIYIDLHKHIRRTKTQQNIEICSCNNLMFAQLMCTCDQIFCAYGESLKKSFSNSKEIIKNRLMQNSLRYCSSNTHKLRVKCPVSIEIVNACIPNVSHYFPSQTKFNCVIHKNQNFLLILC